MEEKEAKVFKFRDIFKAWNHSWRFHRLFISAIALIISALIAFFLFRVPFFKMNILTVSDIAVFSLFTFRNILAIVLIAFIFFIARMCIAFSIRREAVDDEIFVGWKDIGKFLCKHFKTFIFYVLGWILIFVLLALGQLFFYAIGAIPYVGSLWLSIMYLIPLGISVFFILTLVVLLFADCFGSVIIGVEQKSAMDTIISMFHLVKDKGIYIIVTHFISAIVGAIAFAFVLAVLHGSILVTSWGAKIVMGGEFTKITLPPFFNFLSFIFKGLAFETPVGGYYFIPGFIIGICLIVVASVGFSYSFTYMSAADTFIYLSSQEKFYPKKEEEEKIEEEEKEEEPEKVEEKEEKPEEKKETEKKEEKEEKE
ncbi:MAG: hypothetical protein ISS28_03165 [Candidatus Cloacimonetes bacterium]|nr:hypothetical protein [Candidatus Cloacimonadota bacterium]MBL7086091.1 hypothetical protein [Candidatus Cloacimonadota bacterium]